MPRTDRDVPGALRLPRPVGFVLGGGASLGAVQVGTATTGPRCWRRCGRT
ncbi:hypothetical protein [Kineococcus gypseus]